MKLSELATELTNAKLDGGDAQILSLCTDSRVAGEGDLFFCLKGLETDSHLLAAEAEARGAAAVVCEYPPEVGIPRLIVPDARAAMAQIAAAFYGHPERKMRLIGVTGTNGKTTVSHMLCNILTAGGECAGLIGTLGARFQKTVVPPALTTPDPVSLFSLLADMQKSGVTTVVMEVSAHALALRKTAPIRYEIAIFTNFTQDHLDFFGDMQSYGDAKRRLFTKEACRFAVLNADDPFSRTLPEDLPATTYGLDSPADCFAMVESEEITGARFLLNLEDELVEVDLPMTGRHNIANALAAATAAKKLGMTAQAIAAGLEHTRVEGRLERVASVRGAEIFVDFAHTPDGVQKALLSLRPYCEGRLILLFGCGGNRDREKRPRMGEIAGKLADFVVLTSDNPRYEDPAAIIAEIETGLKAVTHEYVAVEEREKATALAIGLLGKGDVLLLAGKGGETEQEIMGIKYAYNDKAVVKRILENG